LSTRLVPSSFGCAPRPRAVRNGRKGPLTAMTWSVTESQRLSVAVGELPFMGGLWGVPDEIALHQLAATVCAPSSARSSLAADAATRHTGNDAAATNRRSSIRLPRGGYAASVLYGQNRSGDAQGVRPIWECKLWFFRLLTYFAVGPVGAMGYKGPQLRNGGAPLCDD
jgi:hypothetical protein